jgi:hypothetical protein
MAAETWFDAKDALDLGLATRTIEPVRIAASFDVARLRNAPPGLAEAIEAGGLVLDAESPMHDEDPVGAEPETLAEDKSSIRRRPAIPASRVPTETLSRLRTPPRFPGACKGCWRHQHPFGSMTTLAIRPLRQRGSRNSTSTPQARRCSTTSASSSWIEMWFMID